MQKHYNYLDIDLDNKNNYRRLNAMQGDIKTRYILVNLYSNNLAYDLSNCTVKIYGLKRDKTIFFNNAVITNEKLGQFEIELTNQALAVAGELKIQILVLGAAGEKLTSSAFFIDVGESIIDENAIESANEFNALTESLTKVNEWDSYFEETSGKIEEKYTERLNSVDSQIKENTRDISLQKNNIYNIDLNIKYNYSRILSGMDVNWDNGYKGIYEGEYVINDEYKMYSNKKVKALMSNFSLSTSVKDSYVIKDGDTFYMFYTSFAESDGDIGVATSSDLKSWIDKGIIVRKNQVSWTEKLPIWGAYVTAKQKDGYYYMFVSGAYPYRSCMLKSRNLLDGWEYVDYVRDNTNNIIAGIDVDITYIDNQYIMLIANNKSTPAIEMYVSDDVTTNQWIYVKDVITKTEGWEGSVVEAGQLIKINNTQYAIFYAGGSSHINQHIGLAVGNSLFGDYKKVGLNGMLLLDLPLNYKGIIAHPNIFYNEDEKLYYIYCTIANSANKNEIICYTTSNFKDIKPLNYSEDIDNITNGIIYINPYDDLILSNLVPNSANANVTFGKNLRLGFIVLGYLENSKYNKFRMYENVMTINAKNEKTNLINDEDSVLTGFINVKVPTSNIATRGTLVAKLMLTYKNSVSQGFNFAIAKNGNKIPIFTKNLTSMGVSNWLNFNSNWEKWTVSDIDDIYIISKRNSNDGYYSLGENTSLNFAIEY